MKTVNPRWGRIQELFNRAADMPLAERGPFLDVECDTDAVLRKELDELLAADAASCSWRSTSSVLTAASPSTKPPATDAPN